MRGRTSGAWRTTPVNLLDHRGRRYLVSARGEGQWVRNLRVAGTAAMGVRSLSVDLAGRPRRNALARGAAPVTVPLSRLTLDSEPTPEILTEQDTAPGQLANPAAQ